MLLILHDAVLLGGAQFRIGEWHSRDGRAQALTFGSTILEPELNVFLFQFGKLLSVRKLVKLFGISGDQRVRWMSVKHEPFFKTRDFRNRINKGAIAFSSIHVDQRRNGTLITASVLKQTYWWQFERIWDQTSRLASDFQNELNELQTLFSNKTF